MQQDRNQITILSCGKRDKVSNDGGKGSRTNVFGSIKSEQQEHSKFCSLFAKFTKQWENNQKWKPYFIFASPRIKQLGFAVFGSETHSFRTMKLEGSENSSGATRNFISLEVISTLELGGGGVPE